MFNMFSRSPTKQGNNTTGSAETIESLKKKLETLNSELEELMEMKARFIGLGESFRTLEKDNKGLEEKDKKNLAKIQELETEIAKYQAEINELQARINACEAEFREKKQQQEQLIATLEATQKVNRRESEEEKAKLQEKIDERDRQIQGLSEKLEEQNNEIKTLTTQVSERNSTIENLKKDLDDEKKANTDLTAALAEKSHGSVLKCNTAKASKTKRALIGVAVGGTIAATGCIAALVFIHVTFPPIVLVTGAIAIIALGSVVGGMLGYHASKISAAIKGVFYKDAGADNTYAPGMAA